MAALTTRAKAGTSTITLLTSGDSRWMKQVWRNLSSQSRSMERLTMKMARVWRVLTVLNTKLTLASTRLGSIREQVKNVPGIFKNQNLSAIFRTILPASRSMTARVMRMVEVG